MKIEKMCWEDVCKVAEIEKECFENPWSEKSIENELYNEYAHFFVLKTDGKVAGYVGCHIICGEGYIANIAIRKEYRGQGLSKKLLRFLIEYAKQENADFLSLEVRKSNIIAKSLYEGLLFTKVGERKNFYKNPTENGEIYTIFLS